MRHKIKQANSFNNSKQQRERKTPKVIGLGLVKLDFYININDEILKRHAIDLSKINSPKDLTFIADDPNLLDLVQISTTDTLTNVLLYLNKANIQKSFVELITLNPLRFRPEEEHMRKIFSHVTEHNYLFTNEMNVATTPNKISFAIKSGKKLLKYWDIVADYDPFAEEIKKEENLNSKSLRTEKNVIKEEEELNAAGKNLYTNSNLNVSHNKNEIFNENNVNEDSKLNDKKNNTNNFENFNNNENSRIKTNEDNNKGESSLDNQDEFGNMEQEVMENEGLAGMDGAEQMEIENQEENAQEADKNMNNPIEDENMANSVEANKERSNLDFKVEDIQNHDSDNQNLSNNGDLLDKVEKTEKNENLNSLNNQQQTQTQNHLQPANNLNTQNTKGSANIANFNKKPSFSQHLNQSENLEISRTNQSMYKLFNIPAACEIEEYDFIFLDLEEFLNFHGTGLHLIELADFIKKIAIAAKTPRIVVNFPNILLNINIINLELIDIILTIMSYTDVFLFDKKECLAFFNMLSQMNNERELSEKNLFEHFQKQIPHIKSGVAKVGLFLDELQKFTVIEQKGEKLINKNDFLLNLHPKINHTNQKVVDDYRKIMMLNNSYLRSIFFGGYFAKYLFLEDHHPAFISGIESTKRILELFKNKIDFPADPEFYIVKIQQQKIDKDLARESLRKKEEQFVLDCINKKTASIKHYNPLFDDHLNSFFAGEAVRKQLKDKGFINTNGFVLYDPSYKNISPPKNVKKRIDTAEKEKRLLYAIKNNKDIFSTDLESYSRSIRESSPTNRRLPLPTFTKDSSNLYFPDKLYKMKNAQKRTLKPLYLSVTKKEKDQKEEREREREKSLNNSLNKKNTSSINSKNPNKAKNNAVFPTQNFHNLNKSHLNSALNKSDFKDEKHNNISKLENSIVEHSVLNKNENAESNKSERNSNVNKDKDNNSVIAAGEENKIGENLEGEIVNNDVEGNENSENNNADNAVKDENEEDKGENAEQDGEAKDDNDNDNENAQQAENSNENEVIEEVAA